MQEEKQESDNSENLSIEERLKLFYTDSGYIGKSVLDLLFLILELFDNAIIEYESKKKCEPDIPKLIIVYTELIGELLDKFYQTFYEAIMVENREDKQKLLEELRTYHHETVQRVSKEIRERKSSYYKKYGGKFIL